MADCPNCGTWNPDDKRVCWRCQTPLPKPQPEKRRNPAMLWGLPLWTWVILVLMTIIFFVTQCGLLQTMPR
ncbi:MAG TPA: hypothetical protein G4O02_09450 [Caldilineae bacterium]|jgi:predicted nucleic acid-binding Zn ribbon protein|nr:hypothetical protein [Caldilineae bacterium]